MGSFASIPQPPFPEFAGERRQRVRPRLCPASIAKRSRPHASRETAPSVSTVRRLFAFLRCVRFTEPQLSRHSRSSIHRESGRYSQNSFRASVLNPTSPNHALQRTAPRVTVAAISSSNPSRPSGALFYARCRQRSEDTTPLHQGQPRRRMAFGSQLQERLSDLSRDNRGMAQQPTQRCRFHSCAVLGYSAGRRTQSLCHSPASNRHRPTRVRRRRGIWFD